MLDVAPRGGHLYCTWHTQHVCTYVCTYPTVPEVGLSNQGRASPLPQDCGAPKQNIHVGVRDGVSFFGARRRLLPNPPSLASRRPGAAQRVGRYRVGTYWGAPAAAPPLELPPPAARVRLQPPVRWAAATAPRPRHVAEVGGCQAAPLVPCVPTSQPCACGGKSSPYFSTDVGSVLQYFLKHLQLA